MGRKRRSLEERLRLYDEVMRLRSCGLGYKRIAKSIREKYGVPLNPGTVRNWVKKGCHPLGSHNRLVAGPELAYVIGAWLGDGSLNVRATKGTYCIRLSCKDYDFAREWGRCLAKTLGKSKPYVPKYYNCLRMWLVRGCSVLLYSLLEKAREESPWILMPYLEKHPAEACRGFFDAEGHVSTGDYRIAACNTDPSTIDLFRELLKKLGIDCKTYRYCPPDGRRTLYVLVVSRKDNVLGFAEKVGFTIARKQAKLMQLVEKYGRSKIRISRNRLEKCARGLIATNLVRLDLVSTQKRAAKLLSVNQGTISYNLHRKERLRLLKLPEIEQLSREYFHSRSGEIIARVRRCCKR